ncbi:hypothetical protein AGMMS49965_04350 [Bacteroidia bacterium]|nr:hypothetical protein AGMMS49965_04350 [Bacteroidia bacterium]
MKKFLITLSVYIVLLIAGAFMLDLPIEKGIRKIETGGFQVWNALFDSKISSEVIISGSSRAATHISPQILDSVLHINSYNLGMIGHPYPMQQVRFKLFEKYNQKPKLVIQNVECGTFFRPERLADKGTFVAYIHEDLIGEELTKRGMTKAALNIPSLRYHGEPRVILRGLLVEFLNWTPGGTVSYKGYEGYNRDWDGSKLDKILSGDSIVAKREPELVELFDSYLGYCKENGIQVILVYTPQYIKATEFTKNWDGEMQLFRDFAEKYDIPFLDYTHDPICNDTTYFFDSMHLNKKGAELFTLKLANDIKAQNLYKSGDCGVKPATGQPHQILRIFFK